MGAVPQCKERESLLRAQEQSRAVLTQARERLFGAPSAARRLKHTGRAREALQDDSHKTGLERTASARQGRVPEQPSGRGEGEASDLGVRAPEHDGQQGRGAGTQAVSHHHQPVLLRDETTPRHGLNTVNSRGQTMTGRTGKRKSSPVRC